ncbi:MAG: hypothetical protein NXH70_02095 [Hyphomonas sp.]|nr:hypothetical protein [Hyphomonas sp.]
MTSGGDSIAQIMARQTFPTEPEEVHKAIAEVARSYIGAVEAEDYEDADVWLSILKGGIKVETNQMREQMVKTLEFAGTALCLLRIKDYTGEWIDLNFKANELLEAMNPQSSDDQL